ncbi:glycosyltransferase [Lacinutrix sp. 5H-3-7-4]|uniref:glycosyltransferase n=1 Tax=Lacinutrix sp. (strain 5H-3-7-4) TaxID=983544 RepID=UPI00020A378C|nr:glycosyltransferase [Lacinutrix sp. 5H-3-7-4]AEG99955.1 glycosyl transferase group 1 [Lacinutrix sp. 5H-3-7-4]
MKVLQLIDSLEAGGAERMAISIANSLVGVVTQSYLCTTRAEGLLKDHISNAVSYLYLEKQSTFDIVAIKRLDTFVKTEEITIIHAHSSSYFLATLIKILNKKVRIVWHDHYGNRAASAYFKIEVLKYCSKYFSHIICVNKNLVGWSQKKLKCKQVSYLPNFVKEAKQLNKTKLFGVNGKRIVCLANLRPDKDILNAIDAFTIVLQSNPDWTLHLVGKTFNDDYSQLIRDRILTLNLSEQVFLYGSVPDSLHVLQQSSIGILSSKSEGLPVALLEYGLAGLPVVVTDVGDCASVILDGALGMLVPSKNKKSLANAILFYINNPKMSTSIASKFNKHILENFSATNTVDELLLIYNLSLK